MVMPPEPETLTPLPERISRALNAWAKSDRHHAPEAPHDCACLGTGWLDVTTDQPWRPCPEHGPYERWKAGCLRPEHTGCARCHPRRRTNNEGARPDRERVPRQTDHRAHEWDEDPEGIF